MSLIDEMKKNVVVIDFHAPIDTDLIEKLHKYESEIRKSQYEENKRVRESFWRNITGNPLQTKL